MGVDKLKKETIGIVIVCLILVVSAVGIGYLVGVNQGDGEPEAKPTYILWECTDGTWNETRLRLQIVYNDVYPDSYESEVRLLNDETGEIEEYTVYCEVVWSIQHMVIESTKGDEPTPEPSGYTDLVPITENATVTVTVNHNGTANVIQVNNEPRTVYIDFWRTITIDKDELLNGYERVYLYVWRYSEYPTSIWNQDDQTIQTWVTVTYAIVFFTSDGTLIVANLDQMIIIDMVQDDLFIHATIDYQDDDSTTYTFHYPKIIGWD